jgi:predicted nucleic acid-binding protein
MIVLDTTVLAYAVGDDHALREPCRRILTAHGEGLVEATTTIEVIQEVAHIRARRRGRADAVALARAYLASFEVLVTSAADLERGLTIFEQHPELGAFDAVLAAVALERGADALVSADQAFGFVSGLPWIDPATPAIEPIITSRTGRTRSS